MGRRYRRRRSANSIISDSTHISSKLSWVGALIFGFVTFTLFYFIIPAWLSTKAATQPENTIFTQGMLEAIIAPRIRWIERIGVACGLIGLFFSIRNYFIARRAGYRERSLVGLLARLFGRDLS